MPHVIVKLWPGKTERQKAQLAERITKDVMDTAFHHWEGTSPGQWRVRQRDSQPGLRRRESAWREAS